jgi:hypothetical protein
VQFTAELWDYQGEGAWHFLTLPTELAEDIRERMPPRRGFGSVRVEATIGDTTWRTSLFPDKSSGSYLLPVKKQVRVANDLEPGVAAHVTMRLLDA